MNRIVSIDNNYRSIFGCIMLCDYILYFIILLIDVLIIVNAPLKISLLFIVCIIGAVSWLPLTIKGLDRYINSNKESSIYYILAATLALMLCPLPICLYLLVGQNWGWLTEFGALGVKLSLMANGWIMPVAVYLFAPSFYFISLYELLKHSTLHLTCTEKLKEIYE